jgi:hypothetical protein
MEEFEIFELEDFRLIEVEDYSIVFTDITVEMERTQFGDTVEKTAQVRLSKIGENGDPAILGDGIWTMASAAYVTLLAPAE